MKMKHNQLKPHSLTREVVITFVFIMRNLFQADEIQLFSFISQCNIAQYANMNTGEMKSKFEAEMKIASSLKSLEEFITLFKGDCCRVSEDTICLLLMFYMGSKFPVKLNYNFLVKEITKSFGSENDINSCFSRMLKDCEDADLKELLKSKNIEKLAIFIDKKNYNSTEITKIQQSIHNLMVK
jgi:hypothetical protein